MSAKRPTIVLVDATYELFRMYFGAPPHQSPSGIETGAVRGVCSTLIYLCTQEGATHVACATDRVVRSFRNDLYDGYKTEEGVAQDLMAQFPIVERAIEALGFTLWPMVEYEADDALATAAVKYADQAEQIIIATPDKDLGQCVDGQHVVMLDRRRDNKITDEAGVIEKFGVPPASIPDYLALVGDAADGFPGIPGWGAKSSATVLTKFATIDAIPDDASAWGIKVRGAEKLAKALRDGRKDALLFRTLATLRRDVPITETIDDLAWRGATPDFRQFCEEYGLEGLAARVPKWQ